MKKGDRVTATYEGRSIEALVILASSNGRSLIIAWDDGMLGGHVGMMPILQDASGEYSSVIEGKPITLTPKLERVTKP